MFLLGGGGEGDVSTKSAKCIHVHVIRPFGPRVSDPYRGGFRAGKSTSSSSDITASATYQIAEYIAVILYHLLSFGKK